MAKANREIKLTDLNLETKGRTITKPSSIVKPVIAGANSVGSNQGTNKPDSSKK